MTNTRYVNHRWLVQLRYMEHKLKSYKTDNLMGIHVLKYALNTRFICYLNIYTEENKFSNILIYFGESQFRRNRDFIFIISKIFVDKRLQVR